jgi:katanin p80 WD40 repeat-containing subunit B1
VLGHKAAISCIEFHPYGEYLASGSLDTCIKLWDTRRKGCIFSYRGHGARINALKFSPDGQWIASAGEEGTVRLWDLRAGKLLTELDNAGGGRCFFLLV